MLATVTRRSTVGSVSAAFLQKAPKRSTNSPKNLRRFRGYSALNPKSPIFGNFSGNSTSLRRVEFSHGSATVRNTFQITPSSSVDSELNAAQFERISDDTLDSLAEYFDELVERADQLPDADVSYGDGVLTIKFGEPHGTYVINRQTPNKQIWLSSPTSGPKRYDFVSGTWVYKHDGLTLHQLLDTEIPPVVNFSTKFVERCAYSKTKK